MEKDFTNGNAVINMMENGSRELSMAMAFGKDSTETVILDSGYRIKLMDTESTNGQMVINTRVGGDSASDMDKAMMFLQMEIFI